MLNTSNASADYRRLGAESPALGIMQENNASASHHISLPVKAASRYVPKKSASKYKAALKSLIPLRRTKRTMYEVPVDSVGFFSYITFNWMTYFLSNKWKPELSEQDIITSSYLDSSDINGQRLKHLLSDENVHSGQLHSSVAMVVWQFVRTRVVIATAIYSLGYTINIAGLMFLPPILTFCNNTDNTTIYSEEVTKTTLYSLGMLLTHVFALFLWAWSSSLTCRTANRLKSAFMNLLYKHLLRVTNLNSISTQQIVTLMAMDSQKLYEAILHIPAVITLPIVFVGCSLVIVFICARGSSDITNCLVAMGVNLIIYPLLYVLMKLGSALKVRVSILGAHRLNLVQEMLAHIRLVKMTTWEKLFLNNAKELRNRECSYENKVKICNGVVFSILHTMPAITATLLLCGFITNMDTISMKLNAVVLVLLFIPIKESFIKFWLGINSISDALASLERLKSVLLLDTIQQYSQKPTNPLFAISISNASFMWDSPRNKNVQNKKNMNSNHCCKKLTTDSFVLVEEELELQPEKVLMDVTFLAPKNKLVGVCGETGSGKTSLLLAILGQLHCSSGEVQRNGSYAYVSQSPWIWDATLRDNILFKEPFHHKRYYQAIHCCSLNDDIAQLPGGDQTRVGPRVLSLAQKQRVTLARALYANKDIFLLDDVLSSVDAEIGTDIFEKAILGHLRQKTVILATRQIKFLSRCDEIYLLKSGKIVDQGTHEELLKRKLYPPVINSYMQESSKKMLVEETSKYDSVSNLASLPRKNLGSVSNSVASIQSVFEYEEQLQDDLMIEKTTCASVFGVYTALGEHFSSSPWIASSMTLKLVWIFCVSIVPLCFINPHKVQVNVYFFAVPIILVLLTCMVGRLLFEKVVMEAALLVHNSWFEKVCNASLTFFQSTFSSDILKWFSVYLHKIDVSLPAEISSLLENVMFSITTLLVLVCISPWFLIPTIIVIILCAVIYHFYKPGLLKLYDLESESSIPLYNYVSSTVNGRTTLQAFGKENDFMDLFTKYCDQNAVCAQLLNSAAYWLAFRVQASAVLMIISVMLVAQMPALNWGPPQFLNNNIEHIGMISIAMLFSLQLGTFLQHVLQAMAMITTRVAVFRNIHIHIRGIETESEVQKTTQGTLPANWPTDGSIVFKNVKMKFWPISPPALKGMAFKIEARKKIGIVGLPGSGKKSIMAALYRLVELSQGSILVGGTNICTVPLEKLRSSIALVPQNPVFFTGSIRLNLDPEHQFDATELHQSLLKIGILDTVKNLPNQLNTRMEVIGDKLSVFERQLLYLARAYLKNPKVLIVEEPLTAIKDGVENHVQDIVDEVFTSSTILVIAHQMKYVLRCDKVIVIKDGQVAEFDTPERLYKNPRSCFSTMMKEHTGNLFETEL